MGVVVSSRGLAVAKKDQLAVADVNICLYLGFLLPHPNLYLQKTYFFIFKAQLICNATASEKFVTASSWD